MGLSQAEQTHYLLRSAYGIGRPNRRVFPRLFGRLLKVIPPMRSTVKQRRNGTDVAHHIDAEMSAEPMPFDCERIVDSGLGWLISMEE